MGVSFVSARSLTRLFVVLASLVIAFASGVSLAAGSRGFGERLEALNAAVDQHLAGANESISFPAEFRRIAWIYLPGDRTADAVLFARPTRDDCAGRGGRRQSLCKVLILQSHADGSYRVAVEFQFHVHPLAFSRRQGVVQSLYYSRSTSGSPEYFEYRFDGQGLSKQEQPLTGAAVQQAAQLQFDDRNIASVVDQAYIAHNFAPGGVALAPARLQIDDINITESRRKVVGTDAQYLAVLQPIAKALAADAVVATNAIAWTQTLELRLWGCVDWMVVRRFWEVESRRLGKVGICIDPVIFARLQGLTKTDAESIVLTRFRLFQEIGIAYLLRMSDLSLEQKARLAASGQANTLPMLGTAVGVILAVRAKLMTFEQASRAAATWRQIAEKWFLSVELERGYLSRTPELQGFVQMLDASDAGLACASGVPGVAPQLKSPGACDGDLSRRLDEVTRTAVMGSSR